MLSQDVGEDSWLEWHIQSVELLASISENRNPTAQIYASSQMTCRMAMDAAASAEVKISGERIRASLPVRCVSFGLAGCACRILVGGQVGGGSLTIVCHAQQLFRVRAAHYRFIKAVYAKTEVNRLFEELQGEHSGFWGPVWTASKSTDRTGMSVMREELDQCAAMQSVDTGNGEKERLEMVFEALIPMLW